MSKIRVRPARASDVIDLIGKPYPVSLRAVTVEMDGKPIGIGGVIHTSPPQAFSTITDELRRRPKWLLKAGAMVRDLLSKYDGPIIAYPSQTEHNPQSYLEWIGFEPTDDGVYQWKPQRQEP